MYYDHRPPESMSTVVIRTCLGKMINLINRYCAKDKRAYKYIIHSIVYRDEALPSAALPMLLYSALLVQCNPGCGGGGARPCINHFTAFPAVMPVLGKERR